MVYSIVYTMIYAHGISHGIYHGIYHDIYTCYITWYMSAERIPPAAQCCRHWPLLRIRATAALAGACEEVQVRSC